MGKSKLQARKLFFAAVVLTFSLGALSAQESLDAVYAQIDLAFAERSTESLSNILEQHHSSKDYNLYEAYTLKKTRQLIIQDDLVLARDVSLVVIDNNLENFDAVDLYSYIDRAILNEEAARQAEENRLRLEAERLAAMNEKTKAKLDKSDYYDSVNTASGSSIYLNQQKSFSSTDWNIAIGIADLLYQTVTKPESYNSLKYGLAFDGNLYYNTEQYILGAEAFVDFQMLTLGDGEQEIMTSAKLIPMIAFPSFSKHLFYRIGFAVHGLSEPDETETETGSVDTFLTPSFGVGLLNLNLGISSWDLFYDYYLGHLAYDDLKSSMEMGASVMIPMAVNDKTKIGFKLGAIDTLFIKDEGIDNRAKFIMSIGVGNVKN